jgi:uncharacterized membrane protein
MIQSTVHFDAVLHPHRSLSPRAFMVVMAVLGTASFISGMIFLLQGAWPVFGFFGLDVLLVYIAFRRNFRDGRLYERVMLTDETLELLRVTPEGGETRLAFQPYWTKVLVDERGCLLLRSHGRSTELGRLLVDHEKESFCAALDHALRAARTPQFG